MNVAADTPAGAAEEGLILRGLTKTYGNETVLADVDLRIPPGEIHALLGHNGAGKSTLISCVSGAVDITAGTVTLDGRPLPTGDPQGAIEAGVAVIYQHLSLIDTLTVADNLFLGHELVAAGIVINKQRQRQLASQVLRRVGSVASPDDRVDELTSAQRQLVEIAKALLRNPRLIIFDEPTAALSATETERLVQVIRTLQADGLPILYVTHLLTEVMRLADQATVLRNGRVVWASRLSGIARSHLVEAISGVAATEPEAKVPPAPGVALQISGVTGKNVGPVSTSIGRGEIVAFYGLVGSGRSRFLEIIYGAQPRTSGLIHTGNGRPVKASISASIRNGIALIPGDRTRQGLFGSLPAVENVAIRLMRKLSRHGFRSGPREHALYAGVVSELDVKPKHSKMSAGRFSGGNQQKLLIGRWLNTDYRLRALLLDSPTQGVDVRARKDIHAAIRRRAVSDDVAVLFASDDPEEVLALAHRCLIFEAGQVVADVPTDGLTEGDLLAMIHHGTRTQNESEER